MLVSLLLRQNFGNMTGYCLIIGISVIGLLYLLTKDTSRFCPELLSTRKISNQLYRVRLKLLINIAHKLEPDHINVARTNISDILKEIQIYVETAENKAGRATLENTFLKERITDLEEAKTALIQELSGGVDYTSLEFEIWQNAIQVIDYLIDERTRLISLVNLAVSYGGGLDKDFNIESLLSKVSSLEDKVRQLRQEGYVEVSTFKRENLSLQARSATLESERKMLLNQKDKIQRDLSVALKDKKKFEVSYSSLQIEHKSRKEDLESSQAFGMALLNQFLKLSLESHDNIFSQDELESANQEIHRLVSFNDSLNLKLQRQHELVMRYQQAAEYAYTSGACNAQGYSSELKKLRKRISRIRRQHREEIDFCRLSASYEMEDYFY